MKTFRTTIQPEPSKNRIGYENKTLFLGSCFTENIGNKMKELKFPAIVNPFGVLYNPVSVRNAIQILVDNKKFKESDLHFFNDQWLSFYHDTEFSHPQKDQCLEKINTDIDLASKHLKKAEYLIITLGTSWVYKYLETDKIVSNCHKIPAKQFERLKLSVEDIFVEWASLLNKLDQFNKKLKIIFTVSPVRHWKDGAIQNQLSKSTLLLAINQLADKFKNIEYFPAYEIMMDDLRDYRFYADDMLHPSQTAIDYIWDFLKETYFDIKTKDVIKDISKLNRALNHRVLNPETTAHQKFVKSQLSYIEGLDAKYTNLNFDTEKEFFERQIKKG